MRKSLASLVFAAAAAAALSMAVTLPLDAQGFGDRLKKKAKEALEQKAAKEVEKAVVCAVSDQACIDKATAEGKTVKTEGAVSTEGAAPGDAGNAPAAAAKPGEGAWLNYDFVPGDRALYVDDFSADNVGDFPRRLEFTDGNMEIAELKSGGRMLRVTSWPGKFVINLPEVLPERFTIEFDATPGYAHNATIFRFADDAADQIRFSEQGGRGSGGVFGVKHQQQGQTKRPLGTEEMFRGRIMADGKYVKVYMNDERVANIPNAELGRSNKITVEVPGHVDYPAFIGNFSVLAGGKKLYDAIAAKGRVATQGIYFDVGSDRVRPESSPTLKEIATMLKEHPELKLTIEGHTDNAGAAAANQTLSEKRAAAVKAVLVSSYGADGARLQTRGLGASKPAGPNTTVEGRQNNRRVELVKM